MDLTHFIPGLMAALLFGLMTGRWAGRRLSVGDSIGTGLMISLGAVLASTLAPGSDPLVRESLPGICDFRRLGLAGLGDLTTVNEISLNIALFVPLGIALGLVPRSTSKAIAVAAALVLPFAIEAMQLVIVPLGRYCDSADVVDNLTGLLIGLLIGSVVAGAVSHHRRSRGIQW